jgi:hypothetical protein
VWPSGTGNDGAVRARWSDAWLLAAVDWSGGGDFARLIEAADAINHAIPTDEEVEHAIRFLDAAGLLRFSGNSLHLTEEGRRLCKQAESQDIFATLDRLNAFLKERPQADEKVNPDLVLDRSAYRCAYLRYMDDPR